MNNFGTESGIIFIILIQNYSFRDPDRENNSGYGQIRIRPVYNYLSSVMDPDTVGSGIIFTIRILNF